ncbi:polysaccharide pyruvyl transferase family protein [Curtobacterium sp. VKM Ac-2922]|uniref:polysaccharide pyruvyl transferase family protein n=1 Tax=Curtobacterium sp. VKM Ac-2922 TaxID=2929475 RepID=UPI001FB1D8E8|nr:polysaccharide pyruvyl transferase family protein [Curtobacterium sp. VKM Ac-2922]MCJ1714156.1 polysaccharide pyruvyl transferase family protein [Curtobacterium sp. VKM Ac-2922]
MSSQVAALQLRAQSSLQELHAGVTSLILTDFPDHGNIGDSAIALGERRFWDQSGIRMARVQSQPTLTRATLRSTMTIAVHGGGNIGGLYPAADEHRYRLASALPRGTVLIQEPQTVHFATEARRREFEQRFARRENTRIAGRDDRSVEVLRQMMDDVVLSPDPVHLLGELPALPPTQEFVYLRRRDDESAGRLREGIDWPDDPRDLNALRWWANRSAEMPPIRHLFQRKPSTWMHKAERRLERGIAYLSQGEVIVTDRLHAMLLGLQMGRRVIATDNSYGKLSAYAQTWLSGFGSQLELREKA